MTGAQLEDRLARLEGAEEIRHLKARYAALADAKYDADHRPLSGAALEAIAWQQACCFTEDATWDGGRFGGRRQGRREIYEFFRGGPWCFALHVYASPVIEVDGETATGRWTLWQVATTRQEQQPVFLAGTTQERYRRTSQGWLTSSVVFEIAFVTPFDGPGWATARSLSAAGRGPGGRASQCRISGEQ